MRRPSPSRSIPGRSRSPSIPVCSSAAELRIQAPPVRCWMRTGRSATSASSRQRSSGPATDSW